MMSSLSSFVFTAALCIAVVQGVRVDDAAQEDLIEGRTGPSRTGPSRTAPARTGPSQERLARTGPSQERLEVDTNEQENADAQEEQQARLEVAMEQQARLKVAMYQQQQQGMAEQEAMNQQQGVEEQLAMEMQQAVEEEQAMEETTDGQEATNEQEAMDDLATDERIRRSTTGRPTNSTEDCVDKAPKDKVDCAGLVAAEGGKKCSLETSYMLENCQKSCNFCGRQQEPCFDTSPDCVTWQGKGDCTAWHGKAYMEKTCPHACDVCPEITTTTTTGTTTTTTTTTTTFFADPKMEAGRKIEQAHENAVQATAKAKRMACRAMDQQKHEVEAKQKDEKAQESLESAGIALAAAKADHEVKSTKATMLKYEWNKFHEQLASAEDQKKAAETTYGEFREEAVRTETLKDKFDARAHMSRGIAIDWDRKEEAAKEEVDKDQVQEDEAYHHSQDAQAAVKKAEQALRSKQKEAEEAAEMVTKAEAQALKATEWNQRLADRAVVQGTLYKKAKDDALKAGKISTLQAKKEQVGLSNQQAQEAATATDHAAQAAVDAAQHFDTAMKKINEAKNATQ